MADDRPASHRAARPPAALPVYALYGEAAGDDVEWIHVETIAERSRRHDWEIRPHRHGTLWQFLYIERGEARVRLEALDESMRGPVLVVVPPLAAHGFRFAREVVGLVLTVQEEHLLPLVSRAPGLREQALAPAVHRLEGGEGEAVVARLRAVAAELQGAARWRALAAEAALQQLVLALGRGGAQAASADERGEQRARRHLERYRTLVESRFREQPTVADCAATLGITPTQLNRVCRRLLGRPAHALLQSRLVLEAQRELAFTTVSIKQIAHGLGFEDPAYFARFFQRETGRSPSAWRDVAQQGMDRPAAPRG